MVRQLHATRLACLEVGVDEGPLCLVDGVEGIGAEELLNLAMAQIITQAQPRRVLEARPRGGADRSESGS